MPLNITDSKVVYITFDFLGKFEKTCGYVNCPGFSCGVKLEKRQSCNEYKQHTIRSGFDSDVGLSRGA